MKTMLFALAWLVATGAGAQSGKPSAQFSVTDVSCTGAQDGRIQLTLLSGALPVSMLWVNMSSGASGAGQLTQFGQPFVLSGLAHGLYRITLTGANGLDSISTQTINNPAPLGGDLFILTNFGGFPVACSYGMNGVTVYEPAGGTPPYQIAWSNGDVDVRADSLGSGSLSVTVTDAGGCSIVVDTTLTVPDPLTAQVDAEGETCFGQNSGSIDLSAPAGGIPPYLFSLNGGIQSAKKTWDNLQPGVYFVKMEDAAGCEFTQVVLLPSGLELIFDLGPDTTIFSGDSLFRLVEVNPPADTLIWQPTYGVQQISPSTYLLAPEYSLTYQVTAINADGCMATDELHVEVKRERDVYVPNVFAPEMADLTENQVFSVYGGKGIKTVSSLRVYDRFGRLWFENRNFAVNDPAAGWGGTHEAAEAPAGVYLWRAVLLYNDGRELLLQGDVTLVR